MSVNFIMFNLIFFVSVVVGFGLRFLGGHIVSISSGLVCGVLVHEVVRFILWRFF